MRKIAIFSVLSMALFHSALVDAKDLEPELVHGDDWPTRPFFKVTPKPVYRASYQMNEIVDAEKECGDTSKYSVGRKSVFREVASKEKGKVVAFDAVYKPEGGGSVPELNKLYLVCAEPAGVEYYKRSGGFDTGVLVIPYKVRSGDLYGDSTLGPYLALRGNMFSLLATFGVTQVSVADMNSESVETKSGLSYAVGAIFSITETFDVGLVVGKDHLSGSAGDEFKYQDKTWWSFAIGYNFTTTTK